MENEIWKDIIGYEELYQISNYGNVKSLKRKNRKKEMILKNKENKQHFCIVLHKNGKPQKFSLHRLVAIHFIENPLNLPIVEHKDDNGFNNYYKNLEWSTVKKNNQNAWKRGRCENIRKTFKKTGKINCKIAHEKCKKKVYQIDINTNEIIKEWNSIIEATLYIGLKRSGDICSCCRGRQKTARRI
jgi:hypothetical protein